MTLNRIEKQANKYFSSVVSHEIYLRL